MTTNTQATSSTTTNNVFWIAVTIVAVVLLFVGGVLVGRMGGSDVDAAATSGRERGEVRGERIGKREGKAKGEETGKAAGKKDGFKTSYRSAFKRAYAVHYKSAFREARAAEKQRIANEQARAAQAACSGTIVAGRCFEPNYDDSTEVDAATKSECGPGWYPVGVTGACAPYE